MKKSTKIFSGITIFLSLLLLFVCSLDSKPKDTYKTNGLIAAGEWLSDDTIEALKSGKQLKANYNDSSTPGVDYNLRLENAQALASDMNLLLFRKFNFDPLNKAYFEPVQALKNVSLNKEANAAIKQLISTKYQVLQYSYKVDRDTVFELQQKGFTPVAYLPNNAYLVKIDDDKKQNLKNISGLRFNGALPESVKIDKNLIGLINTIDNAQMELTDIYGQDIFVQIAAYRTETLEGWDDLAMLLGASNVVYKRTEGSPRLMLRVLPENLKEVIAGFVKLPGLENIRHFEFPKLLNHGSIWLLQSGDPILKSTPLFDAGITGIGQIYGAIDSGIDTDACQFRYDASSSAQTLAIKKTSPGVDVTDPDNKIIAYYILTGSSEYDDSAGGYHGTMTTGCAVGDNYQNRATLDDPGIDQSDGMAPGAKVVFQDAGTKTGYLYGLAFETQYNLSMQAYQSGVRVHNNSYGLQGTSIEYDQDSQQLDDFCWEREDYTIVFAAGNAGPDEETLGGEGSTAKNTLSLGASMPGWYEDGKDLIYFSSRGPTADGRLKPDIVAPGLIESATESSGKEVPGKTNVYGNQAIESSTIPPNNQCVVSVTTGTSFSAPTAAGMALLARQYFTDGFYPTGERNADDEFVPSSALVRAVMLNSAKNLTGYVLVFMQGGASSSGQIDARPSTHQGWGVITLDDALYLKGDKRDMQLLADIENSDEQALTTGDIEEFTFYAKAGESLRVTLVWNDPAGSVGSGRALVNNLDLILVDPADNTYRGNMNFVGGVSRSVKSADSDVINSSEQIIISSPVPGNYTVRVIAESIPGNGRTYPHDSTQQGYALIVTGDLGEDADVLLPRLSTNLSGISGGCDNDLSLDANEVVTATFAIVNSGDGDSGELTASVQAVKLDGGVDVSKFVIPNDGLFEIGQIAAKTRSQFELKIGLGLVEEDICEKRAEFLVQIKNSDDEIIKTMNFSVVMGVDITDDGEQSCQIGLCNPPIEIEQFNPSRIRQGKNGLNIEVTGQYFKEGISFEFEPDVLEYELIEVSKSSKLEIKNINVFDDADLGNVVVLVANSEEPFMRFEGLLEVVNKSSSVDGDLDTEFEGEIVIVIDDVDDGGGCNSSNSKSLPLFVTLLVLLMIKRRKCQIIN